MHGVYRRFLKEFCSTGKDQARAESLSAFRWINMHIHLRLTIAAVEANLTDGKPPPVQPHVHVAAFIAEFFMEPCRVFIPWNGFRREGARARGGIIRPIPDEPAVFLQHRAQPNFPVLCTTLRPVVLSCA